jgi:malonyl-CoA O-methyltransferase
MPEAAPPAALVRPVDERALRRCVARLGTAPSPPWLHGEVARRMAERLPLVKREPKTVIDWWSKLGGGREVLGRAYPRAELIVVEPVSPSRQAPPPRWRSPRQWLSKPVTTLGDDAAPEAAAELLWSNMALHFVADQPALLQRWRRVLCADGFLMFSTLGPGSLPELRALYRQQGWPEPMAPLVDMHDIGDMLVQAGFADPVMDQELLTLTYADGGALLAELRTLGANASLARAPGLRTPRWRERLAGALTGIGAPARPRLTFEVVYGHAFCPPPRARMAETTTVALDQMRAMMRARRGGPGR